MKKNLPQSFYLQDTEIVAKKLLGKKLVRIYNGKRISGIITETEAYLGPTDKGCHSYGGRNTPKVQSLYLHGGHSYVYAIHAHYCFNVVTQIEGQPEAVLIRALEPSEGIELMQKGRKTDLLKNLTTGPGKTCKALFIDKKLDGKNLTDKEIFIEDAKDIPDKKIVKSKRINIPNAEEAAHWPLRFYIKDNLFISKK